MIIHISTAIITDIPRCPPGWSVSAVAQTRHDQSPGEPDTQRAC